MNKTVFPGWWQVVVAFVIQAVSGASVFTAYSVIAVPLQATFEPSRMVLMFGITATVFGSGLLSPILGAAVDRYSVRKLMFAGSATLATGFLMLSFATSMTQVIIVYAVFMAPSVIILGPLIASALLARWFERRRGLVIGIAASGTAVGGLLIPPLLQGLIDGLEWRFALQVFGGLIFLVTGPLIVLLVTDRPSDLNLTIDGEPQPASVDEDEAPAPSVATRSLLTSAEFWLIVFMLSLLFGGGIGVISNLLPLVLDKGIDPKLGAFLLSINAGSNFGGKLLCAYLVDRLDIRVVFAGILVGVTLGTFCFLQAEAYPMLVLGCFLIGIAGGGTLPLWSVSIARIYGSENIGSVMGLMSLFMMPANLAAAPLYGLIFDRTGSYDNAFIGYIVLLVIAMVALPKLRSGAPKSSGTDKEKEVSK